MEKIIKEGKLALLNNVGWYTFYGLEIDDEIEVIMNDIVASKIEFNYDEFNPTSYKKFRITIEEIE